MEWSEVIEVERTTDVQSIGDFSSLMISSEVLSNMKNYGFHKPSPVQQRAIPTGLSGFDMLVQAKSGTGKTLVFSILAVENLNRGKNIQKLIIATTREVAAQIARTVKKIGPTWSRIGVFTGGTLVNADRIAIQNGVNIAIGTSGRLCQLVSDGIMSLSSVDLFVLDEADQLMSDSFHKDINYLFSSLPATKQVCVFSATYPRNLDTMLVKYMKSPCLIRLNADDVQLIGIKQYVLIKSCPSLDTLVELIIKIQYTQALVFCNLADDCEAVCDALCSLGLDAIYISSQKEQNERNAVISRLTKNAVKVLVSTDLTARGIDATNVNLVINMEPAVSCETYFHRIGRAARYGGYGAAITILSNCRMCSRFCALARDGNVRAKIIPTIESIPSDITTNQEFYDEAAPFVVDEQRLMEKSNEFTKWENRSNGALKNNKDKVKLKNKTWLDDLPMNSSYEAPFTEQGIWRYDRDQMIELRTYCGPVSAELEMKLDKLELSLGCNYNRELAELAADMNKLREIKRKPEEIRSKSEAPKHSKFVPSRLKNKTKFYLRGELLKILEGVQPRVWTEYAISKYNLNEDPFVSEFVPLCEKPKKKEKSTTTLETSTRSTIPTSPPKVSRTSSASNVLPVDVEHKTNSISSDTSKNVFDGLRRYSRKDMIAISKNKSAQWWREYVTSRWDTTQDPFEMDPTMRCSFEEQLRRQRIREKNQRFKLIEERRKAVENATKIVISGRTPLRREIPEETWREYKKRLLAETESDNRKSPKFVNGPVIVSRMTPKEYLEDVAHWSSWLDCFDTTFRHNVERNKGNRIDVGTSTVDLQAKVEEQEVSDYDVQERNTLRDENSKTEDVASSSGIQFGISRLQITSEKFDSHRSFKMEEVVEDITRTDVEKESWQDNDLILTSLQNTIVNSEADSFSDENEYYEEVEVDEGFRDFHGVSHILAHRFAYNMRFANIMSCYLKTAANKRPPFQ